MKSSPSGIELTVNGVDGLPVLKTPGSPTGTVYCTKCHWFAGADALLYPGPCDHEWVPAPAEPVKET